MGMQRKKLVFLLFLIIAFAVYFYSLDTKKTTPPLSQNLNQTRALASQPQQNNPQTLPQPAASIWSRKISIKPSLTEAVPNANPQDLAEFIFNKPQSSWKIWNRMQAHGPNESDRKSSINVSQFQITDDPDSNHNLENFNLQEPVVLFEERLKTVGVLTGTFEIQLKNSKLWETLERQHSLRLIQSFQDLNLYYATANQDQFNLTQLYKDLSQDASVVLVNLEILSKQYEHN